MDHLIPQTRQLFEKFTRGSIRGVEGALGGVLVLLPFPGPFSTFDTVPSGGADESV